LFSSLSFFWHW